VKFVFEKIKKISKKNWVKRSGFFVFLFFLLKGLFWIGAAAIAWMSLSE